MTTPGQPQPWNVEPVMAATIRGLPIQQGSITNLGKGRPAIHSNAKTLKPWRIQVQIELEQCAEHLDPALFPLTGPVAVELVFTMPKPKSAPKRRRTWPTTRPDIDKLARAILDAATFAGTFGDDSQVVRLVAEKSYPLEHPDALDVPGVVIRVGRVSDEAAAAIATFVEVESALLEAQRAVEDEAAGIPW